MKFYPHESMVNKEIALIGKATQMYEIMIEHFSGKEVQEHNYQIVWMENSICIADVIGRVTGHETKNLYRN